MSSILTVARKELRATFLSPVALIFLGSFLLVALFCFFWVESFFTRNLADVRPLFRWLPLLLVFLVSALGMRLWSEERKMGTLEVLFTLPVSVPHLVLGKFLSGLALVGVSLGLTLGVPITVEMLGDLDWGPVLGGYLAALLLAAAYLAVTLWISSLTDNPIVALILSVLACGALFVLGSPWFAGLFSGATADLLRALGTSSRFDSIERGVVDLRDLAYYLSVCTLFLALNVLSLRALRWSRGPQRRRARVDAVVTVALVAANLLVLNVWLAPVSRARIDLTADREYSISPVTRRVLRQAEEPLLIRGYISDKTHPLLAPLVPRIRDTLEEYGVVGGPNVTVEFVDPAQDEDAEREANQRYGIRTTPFRFSDRHEKSVVNAYFTLLIQYGDQFETLPWSQLVEVEASETHVDVRLRNLEYDLTRAVQKVVYGFASVETVFAQLPHDALVTFYVTPGTLPGTMAEAPAAVDSVLKEIAARSGGRLSHRTVDLTDDEAAQKALYDEIGLQPLAMSPFARAGFYLHLVLRVGDHREILVPSDTSSEAVVRDNLVAALGRCTPAALKTVGLVVGGSETPPQQPTMPGMPPPPPTGKLSYRGLEQVLSETYRVETLDLKRGPVPGHVDVLVVLNPQQMVDLEVFALDQFLMRGGSVVVAGGHFALQPPGQMGVVVAPVDTGLDAVLHTYGLAVDNQMVLDERSAPFPTPVIRDLGGFRVREIQLVDYAPFADVRPEQMDRDNPALAGLPGVVLHWPSPVRILDEAAAKATGGGREYTSLLSSSAGAWTVTSFDATPDFEAHPDYGYPHGTTTETYPLAAAVRGVLRSHYQGRQPPRPPEEGAAPQATSVLEISPDTARLVVVGSGAFVSDPVLALSQGPGDAGLANLQLVHNLVDWCLEDVELLDIRTRGSYARTLIPAGEYSSRAWEWGNYLLALLAVAGIGLGTLGRRRRARAIALESPKQRGGAS